MDFGTKAGKGKRHVINLFDRLKRCSILIMCAVQESQMFFSSATLFNICLGIALACRPDYQIFGNPSIRSDLLFNIG